VDIDDIEPVKQILAEFSFGNLLRKVAMGGG
jgi:hypothetical protein